MDEVTRSGGRTIIFVSHNMDAISRLCTKTILLEKGKVIAAGETDDVIGKYLSAGYNATSQLRFPLQDRDVTINRYSITQDGQETHAIAGEEPFNVTIDFSVANRLRAFRTGIYIKNTMGTVISRTFVQDYAHELEEIESGKYVAKLEIPARLLMNGEYHIELKIFSLGITDFFGQEPVEKSVTVHSPKDYNELRSKNTDVKGYFLIPKAWDMKRYQS